MPRKKPRGKRQEGRQEKASQDRLRCAPSLARYRVHARATGSNDTTPTGTSITIVTAMRGISAATGRVRRRGRAEKSNDRWVGAPIDPRRLFLDSNDRPRSPLLPTFARNFRRAGFHRGILFALLVHESADFELGCRAFEDHNASCSLVRRYYF